MSSNTVNQLLNRIPGYGGYRDLERRRESDRLVRESLAGDLQQLADRLGRVAQHLAEEREIASIQYIDRPHQRLTHFISRLRTATYGYAPLFGETQVDGAALDQIAEFDRSLIEQIDHLRERIDALESADHSTDAFVNEARAVLTAVDGLHERFDRRGEVIESGKPQPEESVRDLLAPARVPVRPTAYNLHDGEAVTYDGENYVVSGRVTIASSRELWRDFQLDGGERRHWLRVPATADGEFWWLDEVQPPETTDQDELRIADTSYRVESRTQATAEIIGAGGSTRDRDVTVVLGRSPTTGKLACVYDWRTGQMALEGSVVDPAELELWSREGGKAI